MPDILTYEEIESLKDRREIRRFAESYKNSIPLEKSAPRRVFLSYSHHDVDRLPGIRQFFLDFGAGIYVDRGDNRLPNPPSPETANVLRNEIDGSPRVVVLLSPRSYDSGWIPWELGIADGKKGPQYAAIFPIAEDKGSQFWRNREYLGLYPRIVKVGRTEARDDWRVFDPADQKYWRLKYWLLESSL